ncbi:MAG: xylulokinase, partial [Alphaproteobacteria bacterium]|nr:xylulokinase [Alphaproteobacteria bacterium]
EATCLGAGLLAAVGAGIFPSVQEAAAAMCGAGVSYHPNETDRLKYDQIYHIYKDVYPALKEHFTRLSHLTSELEQI